MKSIKIRERESFSLFRRILKIDCLLSQKYGYINGGGGYFSLQKIIKALSQWNEPCYSVSTIKKTLFAMRVDFNAPIEYSAKNRGYYYTTKSYRLPYVFLSKDEYEIFLFALQSLKTLPQDKLKANIFQNLLTPIQNPLLESKLDESLQDTKSIERIAFLQNDYSLINQDNSLIKLNFKTIYKALKEQKQVTFEYKKLGSQEYEKRHERPYQLLFDTYNKNGWTLWAFDTDRKETRLFLLSRMQNIEVDKAHYALPLDFEFSKSGTSFFGAFSSIYEWDFSIVFYNDASAKIEGKTWGKNQSLTKTKDGGVRLEFTGSEYYEILSWTLSFGADIKIEKPVSLLEDWKDNVNAMAKLATQ